MVLKGYGLWDMGQINSTCTSPPLNAAAAAAAEAGTAFPRRSAASCVLERQILKPVF
jgi:hypothetical protein